MENKKQQKGCSSSSLSQLFGPPKSDALASIFPPSMGMGLNYACSEMRGSWQKEPSWSENHKSNTMQEDNQATRDRGSIDQQERAKPSYLSSSLYYGGQETYLSSTTHQSSYSYPKFKKDDDEDDSSGATRGNWWQGSLYY